MRYATAAAFRTALEARVRRSAEGRQTSLAALRKLVVFERLLARLLVVAPDRWVVKGAVALALRLGERARATMDLDLARRDGEEAATADLLAAQEEELGDFFAFAVERTDDLDAARDGAAVRYRVRVALAERPFEDIVVDVGFGDPLDLTPDRLRGPDLLGFAGLAPIEVPAIPLEQHVAEKDHAYTRTYGGGQRSSRVTDLVDLVLIRSAAAFEAGRLRDALEQTFGVRDTHPIPQALPAPPREWRTPYRRLAGDVGLDRGWRRGTAWPSASSIPSLVARFPRRHGGIRSEGAGRDSDRWTPPKTLPDADRLERGRDGIRVEDRVDFLDDVTGDFQKMALVRGRHQDPPGAVVHRQLQRRDERAQR